jgi:hypothetical protein
MHQLSLLQYDSRETRLDIHRYGILDGRFCFPKYTVFSKCNRILSKLQDRNGANESFYCSSCSIEVFPSEVESLRSKNKLTTPEGVYNQTPYASTKFTEPDLRKKKVEIKGGLAELQKRGIKITSYTESKG